MKFFSALLFVFLCSTAWSASPIAIRDAAASQAKVEELDSKLSTALNLADGRADAFVKALGQNKEKVLAKIDELKAKIVKLSEDISKQPAGKIQQLLRQRIKARLQLALNKLEALRTKIQKLQ